MQSRKSACVHLSLFFNLDLMQLVVLNSCCFDLPTWVYLKLWAKIDPFSHKLIFLSNRAYPRVLFIKFHRPCFLAQGFSLLRSSSGRLGWLASEHQGCAHLQHADSCVWILRTELGSSYLQDKHFADCTISTDADLISDFPSHWFRSGLLCNWWNEHQLPSI